MTINDAVMSVDMLKPNTFNDIEKVSWLTRLDQMLVRTIINAHVRAEEMELPHYAPETDMDMELLAPVPHDRMYVYWLMAQMDLAHSDIDHYNINITLFNEHMKAYSAEYTRQHMPKAAGSRFLF